MFYFLAFFSELILLFFLSRKLVNCLAQIIYKFTRSHRAVVHILAILFLPGTILHELAHLLFAGVMMVPVGELNVVPEIEESGVKLGSVQIAKTDPFRRMIVGVAPVILGMILIFAIFLLVKIGVAPWWQVILALYFIFEISNTMFSSKKDIEGSILFVVLILALSVVILAALYFLNPILLQNTLSYMNQLNHEFIVQFFKLADMYLIAPIVLDLLVVLLVKVNL